jgi:hypothetical protein
MPAERDGGERAAGAVIAGMPSGPESRGDIRRFAATMIAIVAIWLVFVSGRIVTGTVVPWDSKNQFYAFFRFLASSFQAGESPFWNPFHYGGHPSVADPQSLIFTPLVVLWAWLDPAASLQTFDLVIEAHLLVGGLALGVIGRRAGWPVAACVLAAAVFMFGGAAAGRLQHTGIIVSYGLFPLALLLLTLALERRSNLLAAAFAAVATAVALGRNQTALLLCYVLIAAAAVEIAMAPHPLRFLRERAVVLAVMAVVGVLLLTPPLLLTLQFAAQSNRPETLLDQALLGSLHPANLAQLAVADVLGSQGDYWGPSLDRTPEVALTDDSFNYLFVGSLPVVLLLWFGIAGGGAFRRGRRLMTGVLIAALLYALGRYTPAFAFAFAWVPGVDDFRRPVDADFVAVAALAVLSGHLLDDYVRTGMPRVRIMVVAVLAAGAVAAIGYAVLFSARFGHGEDALWAVLKTAPVTLGIVALLIVGSGRRARMAAAAGVTALAVGELLWWNAAFRLNAESASVYAVLDRPAAADADVIAVLEQALRERHAQGARPRVEIIGMGGAWQNLAMVRGIEAINGYNPLRIGLYDRLVAPGESNWLTELREFPPSFDGYDCPLARTLGLTFLVTGRPMEVITQLRRPAADVLMAGPRAWVYRLQTPAPRITFLQRIRVVTSTAVNGQGQLVNAPSEDEILIDDRTPPSQGYDLTRPGEAGDARIVSWRQDRIEIDATSDQGGMLAVHDSWYPGWVAEVDGARVPILRADVLFRGVELPPGRHRVVFYFAPFALENLRDAIGMLLRRKG